MASVNQQTPFPANIQQMDRQYVVFLGTIHAPSPYPVKSQELMVLTASGDVESFSRPTVGQASVKGLRVMYSGLEDTAPWATEDLRVHFKNHRPFLHILSVDRTITVCPPPTPPAPPLSLPPMCRAQARHHKAGVLHEDQCHTRSRGCVSTGGV